MIAVEFPKRVTITSALPYVNGVKHLGNIAGSLLPADIFHRFLDLFEVDNIFICGTDDHGTAVEIGAAAEHKSPKDYAKKYHDIQKTIYAKWNFDFTHFGHTSCQENHEITQEIFLAAHQNGYIIEKTLTIPFCTNCNRFLPDRFTVGTCPACGYTEAKGDQCEKCSRVLDPEELIEPRCAVCNKNKVEFRQENHLFMDYGALQHKLKAWIEKNNHWPDNTRNFALSWIKEGLKPRCITRNLKWGVKVPLEGYENLVFYVWFDAPIGYISITKEGVRNWKDWWTESAVYHFLGKDNVPFHTIFWPGTLIAANQLNYVLPHSVIGYEFLNWNGEKFSTSRGVGLFSDEALDLFPSDYWRFYLTSILPETKDSNFDWDDFQSRINAELIGNYGNLFYRATHFIKSNFSGKVPQGEMGDEERRLQWELSKTIEKVKEHVKDVKLKEALREILAYASLVNKYFQDRKPWASQNSGTTLYTTVNLLNQISLLLRPIVPEAAEKAVNCLGGKRHLTEKFVIEPGTEIIADMLFKKVEDKEIERAKKYRTRYMKKDVTEKGVNLETVELIGDMLPFAEFAKVDLRVATILTVEDHPKADKLYVMTIDMGEEERQLVAGLRGRYSKEELVGRQIIIVANLEPKELRGVKSHGMLLAAEDGTILQPSEKVPNGSKVV